MSKKSRYVFEVPSVTGKCTIRVIINENSNPANVRDFDSIMKELVRKGA
jgi:hypothetical protein